VAEPHCHQWCQLTPLKLKNLPYKFIYLIIII
jgi:hypothetical protein